MSSIEAVSHSVLKLPEGFLVGAATSDSQNTNPHSPNAPHTDWGTYLTQSIEDRGIIRIINRIMKKPTHKEPIVRPTDVTPAWHDENHAIEDFRLAKELDLNCLRISIEWGRCFPEEDKIDEEAIKEYEEWIGELERLGITPVITLSHFSLPLWMEKQGGWASPKVVEAFTKYAKVIVERFKKVPYWIIDNEPELKFVMGYLSGDWPPHRHNPFAMIQGFDNMKRAYGIIANEIKINNPDALVSVTNGIIPFEPNNSESSLDRKVCELNSDLFNGKWMRAMNGLTDYHALDIYTGWKVAASLNLIPRFKENSVAFESVLFGKTVFGDEPRTDMGWPIVPELVYKGIVDISDKFTNSDGSKKPVFITESGAADNSDRVKAYQILSYLMAFSQAMEDGVKGLGFLDWTLVDNIELGHGVDKFNFGLYRLDPVTGERELREGSNMLGDIAKGRRDIDGLARDHIKNPDQRDRIQKFQNRSRVIYSRT